MLPSDLTDEERQALDIAVRHDLWRCGDLSWKLDSGQQQWVREFTEGEENRVWCVGRQRGKSFAALTMAIEFALKNPGCTIRYCAKTKDSAWGIVEPTLRQIIADKPDDVVVDIPTHESDPVMIGKGSVLIVFGTDAQSFAKGRGPRTHLQLFDECGFYQDLLGVESALMPSLQTTGGKALYLSTPPESVGHLYAERIRAAQGGGTIVHDTFWSNPRVSHEKIIRQEAALRGMSPEEFVKSTYFRREYLAELVTEESRAAIPCWNTERAAKQVREVERPKFFDAYFSLDLGFGDPHAALFGYLDFVRATLVIEDELELRNANTGALADGIKRKERDVWGAENWTGTLRGAADVDNLPEWLGKAKAEDAPPQPYLRYGDNDPLALSDLHGLHGIAVIPTRKDEKHLQANEVDLLIRMGRIVIHPRCKRLIQQLHTTIWNKQRTEWERTPLDHGDLVDALIYMVRNVVWNRDPRPLHYGVDLANTWIPPPPKTSDDVFGELFGVKR